MNLRRLQCPHVGQLILTVAILALACLPAGFGPCIAAAEEKITVQAQDRELGDVLDEISRNTSYRFIMEKEWEDYRVTANLNGVPVDVALKRLLYDFNSAVVYGADNTIKIMIYGEESKTRSSGGSVRPYKPPPPPKVIPAPIPAPSVQRSEEVEEDADPDAEADEEDLDEEELDEEELDDSEQDEEEPDEEDADEEELDEADEEVETLLREPGDTEPGDREGEREKGRAQNKTSTNY